MKLADIIRGKGLLAASILSGLVRLGWSQNVGIGTATPHPSARLDVFSTTSGILIPRMTTAERDAIPNPENSVVIYNTTTRCFETYNALLSQWEPIYCMCDQPPAAPTALPATNITPTGFQANWTAHPQAIKYFIDVATDPGFTNILLGYNSLDVGNTTYHPVTGLSCNTNYYYRIRVLTPCGLSSSSLTTSATPGPCPRCIAIGGSLDETHGSGKTMAATPGGGFIMVSRTLSYGVNGDILVTNTDAGGNMLWTRVIGGSGDEIPVSIAPAAGGGYYIGGGTSSYGQGSYDAFAMKIDVNGNVLWMRTIGTTSPDLFYDLISTSDGGCVGIGYYQSQHCCVVKFDANGNLVWNRVYEWMIGDAVVEIPGGGFYLSGISGSQAFIGRLDISGNVVWMQIINISTYYSWGREVLVTSDGGVVCPIVVDVPGLSWESVIVKFDQNGSLQWHTPYIGNLPGVDRTESIIAAPSGGFYAMGFTSSYTPPAGVNGLLIKISDNGNIQWAKVYGGNGDEHLNSAIIANGALAMYSYTNSFGSGGQDGYLVLADPADGGNSCCGYNITLGTHQATVSVQNLTPNLINLGTVSNPSPNTTTGGNVVFQCP